MRVCSSGSNHVTDKRSVLRRRFFLTHETPSLYSDSSAPVGMLNRIGALVTLALATIPVRGLECPSGTCTALPGQDQFFCNHCPGTFCDDFFCKAPRCKLDCSGRSPPPPPSPSPPPETASAASAASFLKLTHTAFVQAENEFANRGTCRDDYRDGAFDTRLEWTQFKWYDEEKLQVDITDRTHATLVAGSGKFGYDSESHTNSADGTINFGTAFDCRGPRTASQLNQGKEGVAFIDLRGTDYKIAGAAASCTADCNKGECLRTDGGTPKLCGQWAVGGWESALSIECSNNNQRCTVRCGGSQGYCWVPAPRLKPTLPLTAGPASRARAFASWTAGLVENKQILTPMPRHDPPLLLHRSRTSNISSSNLSRPLRTPHRRPHSR